MKKIIKPWGHEKLLEVNTKFMVKELFMKKGHRCSLQYHKKKKRNILCYFWKIEILLWFIKKKIKNKNFWSWKTFND